MIISILNAIKLKTTKPQSPISLWKSNLPKSKKYLPKPTVNDLPATNSSLIHPDAISLKSTHVVHEQNNQKNFQINPVIILPELKPLPRMNYWLPIQHNIVVEDEKVQNLPFFGDEHSSQDEDFYKDLNTMDREKERAKKPKESLLETDEIVLIINKLFAKFDVKLSQIISIFHSIAYKSGYQLPSKNEIYKHYFEVINLPRNHKRLVLSGINESRIKSEKMKKQAETLLSRTTQRIYDNLKSVSVAESDAKSFTKSYVTARTPQKILSTFHDLYCPRCHKFDCLDHHQMPRPSVSAYKHKIKYDTPKMPEANAESCSGECYLKLPKIGEFFGKVEKVFATNEW